MMEPGPLVLLMAKELVHIMMEVLMSEIGLMVNQMVKVQK